MNGLFSFSAFFSYTVKNFAGRWLLVIRTLVIGHWSLKSLVIEVIGHWSLVIKVIGH